MLFWSIPVVFVLIRFAGPKSGSSSFLSVYLGLGITHILGQNLSYHAMALFPFPDERSDRSKDQAFDLFLQRFRSGAQLSLISSPSYSLRATVPSWSDQYYAIGHCCPIAIALLGPPGRNRIERDRSSTSTRRSVHRARRSMKTGMRSGRERDLYNAR
jgi:hypothetical protein